MDSDSKYSKKAVDLYWESMLKSQERTKPGCDFDIVDDLWRGDNKKVFFPETASAKVRNPKGFFINFKPGAINPLRVLPSEFINLINIKRYFDKLEKIDSSIHHKDKREDIVSDFDERMMGILKAFSEIYKKVKRPIYHVFDNNIPSDRNCEGLSEESKKEFVVWNEILEKNGGRAFFKDSSVQIEDVIKDILLAEEDEDKIFSENYLIIIDIVLGTTDFNGIDIVKEIRKNKVYNFLPIIVVSKHFSDHIAADSLVMAKADWFISKGIIGEISEPNEPENGESKTSKDKKDNENKGFNKLEELGIISVFLDALRYREYFKHFLLFVKFFLIYLYLKTTKDCSETIFNEIKKINDFIRWIEGEDEQKDFPQHKPHFIMHIAKGINDSIDELLDDLEHAVDTQKNIPEKVFRTIVTDIYDILEKELEPFSKKIGLRRSEEKPRKPIETVWVLPFKGGTIETDFLLNLLGIRSDSFENEFDNFLSDVQKEEQFYIVWQRLISNAIEDNKRWT